MKKILLIWMIVTLSLTGCTYNLNDIELVDSSLRFNSYEEFKELVKDLDPGYFSIERLVNIKVEDLDSLSIDLVFEDVTIYREKREDIEIRYYGIFSDATSDDAPQYTIEDKSHGKFKVKWDKLVGENRAKADIYLPESYELPLIFNLVSSDLKASDLAHESIEIQTVSGDIRIEDIRSENFMVSTISGDLRIDSQRVESFDVNTTSGDIRIERSDIEKMRIKTASGEIRLNLDEHRGDIEIETTSGDIRLTMENTNTYLDIETLSGDIRVEAKEINLQTSDDRNYKAEIGKGEYKLIIDTISGDVRINQ